MDTGKTISRVEHCSPTNTREQIANMPKYLTVEQAAAKLKLSRQRVRALIREGRIKAEKLYDGGPWLMREKDLEAFAAIERTPGRPGKDDCGNRRHGGEGAEAER